MPNGQRHLATRLGDGTLSPLESLRLNYRRQDHPGELTPAEIVAQLRAEIAAKSPEHARLVARYEAAERAAAERPRLHIRSAERVARMEEYARLRRSGMSKRDARGKVGVSKSVGHRYEADMRLIDPGEAS